MLILFILKCINETAAPLTAYNILTDTVRCTVGTSPTICVVRIAYCIARVFFRLKKICADYNITFVQPLRK